VSDLSSEYVDDKIYISKVNDLTTKYKVLRRTRPDGNCFFRAFAYSYLEYLVGHSEEFGKFSELAHQSKDKLIKLGFPSFTIEDFHDTVGINYK
jgi:ubiquitin thioesterase protein OTUB1